MGVKLVETSFTANNAKVIDRDHVTDVCTLRIYWGIVREETFKIKHILNSKELISSRIALLYLTHFQ